MTYILVSLLLLAAELFYFKIADHFNIIDKPNERSSHTKVTLRGGGVIFWIAALIYFTWHPELHLLFFIAITMIAAISFWDDVATISGKPRLIVQLIAMSIVFYEIEVFTLLPWWAIIFGYIFFVGVLNAYNFMDGINGITGLYSLVVLASLQYVNFELVHFTDPDFIWVPMIASSVFLLFNFRTNAKCFAGDVGSVTIAFWVVVLLLRLIEMTQNPVWILFLSMYGVDTVCTIIHRIYLQQNILLPHRLHFFQVLANECRWPHLVVSTLYATMQLAISVWVIYSPLAWYFTALTVLVPLMVVYCFKFSILSRCNQ